MVTGDPGAHACCPDRQIRFTLCVGTEPNTSWLRPRRALCLSGSRPGRLFAPSACYIAHNAISICALGWLVDWLVVCLYWAFARAKALASAGIGSRRRRWKARVVGVIRGRGRYGALLVDLVCPADVGHSVNGCSNARRSAAMACHSRARAPDRQNKERIC